MADGPFHFLVFVKRLQDMGKLMQRSGGGLLVQCPAHDDRSPSMSVTYKADGDQRILVNCKAGCTAEQICKAMGGKLSMLFAGRFDGTTGMQKQTPRGNAIPRPVVAPIPDAPKLNLTLQATYTYRDPEGVVVSLVERYLDLDTHKKTFTQRKPDGTPGIKGVKRWLYRISDWKGKQTLSLAEGEKCVEALWAIGIPATCNLGGSSGWLDEYADQAVAQGVTRAIIFVDNDEPGRKWAAAVAASFFARSAITEVKIVELSGLAVGEDVFDYLATHPREDLIREVRATPAAERPEPEAEVDADPWIDSMDLEEGDITYIIDKMIPSGMLGAIGGRDKRGKSFLGLEVAKSILTETNLFGAEEFPYVPDTEGRTKVYMALLDDPERLVRARLKAMGILGHPEMKVTTARRMDAWMKGREDDLEGAHLEFVKMLSQRIIESRPRFVLIDALYLFVPGGKQGIDQGNSAGAMMPIVQEFNRIAEETGATVALVVHNNKADSDLFGSQVIRNMMKWIVVLALPKKFDKDKQGARTTPDRILQLDKLKSGASNEWGLRIVGTADPNRIQWDVVPIEELEAKEGKKKKSQMQEEWIEWVRFYLAAGAKTFQDVREAAYEAGYKKVREWNIPELRERAGIELSHPKPNEPWYWRLREEVPSGSEREAVQAEPERQGGLEGVERDREGAAHEAA